MMTSKLKKLIKAHSILDSTTQKFDENIPKFFILIRLIILPTFKIEKFNWIGKWKIIFNKMKLRYEKI